jgi:hypothetical protein
MYGGVLVYDDKTLRQFAIFKVYGLHSIGSALPIIQDTLHGSVPQAFKIDAFDFFLRYVQPRQQLPGFEWKCASLNETGSESTVETMKTPTLIRDLDAATLPAIR